jgi:hypothetical protein
MSGAMPLVPLPALWPGQDKLYPFCYNVKPTNAHLLQFFNKYLPHVSSLKGSFQELSEDEPSLMIETFRRYFLKTKIVAGVHLVVLTFYQTHHNARYK